VPMLWLLIGYMWLFIHRPFEIWPSLGEMRIELIYMLLTGFVWLTSGGKRFFGNILHFAYAGFALALLACVLLSPWSDACYATLDGYWKFLVFYLILVTIVHDEENLKRVALAFLVAMSIYMLHSYREFLGGRYISRMGISRMVGVDTSYSDPNAFGSSVVLAMVFVPAVWTAYSSKLVRAFLLGFLALGGICVSLTGSRGSFLCLVVWAAVAIARSRYRWQLAGAAVICSPLMFLALPEKLQSRFETIVDPDSGPANAKKSADARIDGLLTGIRLFGENPLSGIGPGAWRTATGKKLAAHNLYGQLLGEMGMLGALTFSAIVIAFIVNLWQINRAYRMHPEWGDDFVRKFSQAISLALFLLLLQGNFGHNLFRFHWVWFGAFLAVARYCVAQRAAARRHAWVPAWTTSGHLRLQPA
jgi:O-antigen ligase